MESNDNKRSSITGEFSLLSECGSLQWNRSLMQHVVDFGAGSFTVEQNL